jgi:hypothetical protein
MGAGRPRLYKCVEDMQKDIDNYFEDKFENVTDELGNTRRVQTRPFTMSGLANALDMSRQSLLNYKNRDEYFDTITRARRKVEEYAEERLYDRDGVNGAKFNLVNNFDWRNKSNSEEAREERKVALAEKAVEEMDEDIEYVLEDVINEKEN